MRPPFRTKDWREEKIGYASTARLFHGAQRWFLGFETFSRLLFYAAWVATVALAALHAHWMAAGIGFLLFALRFTMQALVIQPVIWTKNTATICSSPSSTSYSHSNLCAGSSTASSETNGSS